MSCTENGIASSRVSFACSCQAHAGTTKKSPVFQEKRSPLIGDGLRLARQQPRGDFPKRHRVEAFEVLIQLGQLLGDGFGSARYRCCSLEKSAEW